MPVSTVQEGLVISVAYTLTLSDGEVIDEASSSDPLLYLHGAENIIPGLERALTGMTVGQRKQVVVDPEDAYGEYDEEGVQVLPRDAFGDGDVELEIGEMLTLRDEEDNLFDAEVIDLDDESVTLDFNHPLAGETLRFDVEIVGVRDATPDERAHGHPHAPGMNHH
ncbi:MAG: peptidylprolyl isomerase [Anaerolineae bacterium]|nr:peptidylprolyl isomerase [Anaerolineae bacterium]